MTRRASLAADLLARARDLVACELGLDFPEQRWRDLERGLVAAARERGEQDERHWAASLLARRLDPADRDALARHLTVGETYFFREKETLRAFESEIVSSILRERDGGRQIRIWSAGCCTGEEPYSIAMILDRLLPHEERSRITITATDLNPLFLEKARAAVYGNWSFRATRPEVRDRHFSPVAPGRWQLEGRLRDQVAFSLLNLAGQSWPSPAGGTSDVDVIFCRNVLMYFAPAQRREVLDRFRRALRPGGWLIVSMSEASDALFAPLQPVRIAGVTVYRNVPAAVMANPPVRTLPPVLAPPPREEQRRPRKRRVSVQPLPSETAPATPASAHFAEARALADQGRLEEARERCLVAFASEKTNPALHYLLAAVERELGDHAAARQSLRRALYLEPRFVLAHVALAHLDLAGSHRESAARHLRNAAELLAAHPAEEVLEESDGLTVARLTEIVTSLLDDLRKPAGRFPA
jgi:chemotaxis protein methyltransferase CheR